MQKLSYRGLSVCIQVCIALRCGTLHSQGVTRDAEDSIIVGGPPLAVVESTVVADYGEDIARC